MAGQGQAQARAPVPARRRGLGLGERLEQAPQLLRGHPDPGVRHPEHQPVAGALLAPLVLARLAGRGEGDLAPLGELGRVGEQVVQGLPHLGQVGPHHAETVRAVHDQPVAPLPGQRRGHGGHALDEVGHREVLREEVHPPGLDLGQIEDVVDQPQQVPARRGDLLQVAAERGGGVVAEVLGLLLEHLRVADDGVEGRAQLVGHVGHELALVPAGLLQLARLHLERPEEAGVLDRHDRLAGEGLQELDDRRREHARRLRWITSMPTMRCSRFMGTATFARKPARSRASTMAGDAVDVRRQAPGARRHARRAAATVARRRGWLAGSRASPGPVGGPVDEHGARPSNSKMVPPSAPARRAACATIVVSTSPDRATRRPPG